MPTRKTLAVALPDVVATHHHPVVAAPDDRAAARQRVALQSLGLSLDPEAPASLSAITWAVIHAVAVECGRKHDDACAIADRWATVADIAGGSPT